MYCQAAQYYLHHSLALSCTRAGTAPSLRLSHAGKNTKQRVSMLSLLTPQLSTACRCSRIAGCSRSSPGGRVWPG